MSFAIGDPHGKFRELYDKLERYKGVVTETDIFVLGDMNVGFYPEFEKEKLWPQLNKYLGKLKSMMYVVRGNHDNPRWFDGQHDYKRIKFLKDYSIVKSKDVEGEPINILVLGGGISINRTSPNFIAYKTWFPEEKFVLDLDFLNEVRDIDIVMSHNCPWFCPPAGINSLITNWAAQDHTLIDELYQERTQLDLAYETISKNNKIKRWYYGHMHQSSVFNHKDTEFICLNELEFKEVWK